MTSSPTLPKLWSSNSTPQGWSLWSDLDRPKLGSLSKEISLSKSMRTCTVALAGDAQSRSRRAGCRHSKRSRQFCTKSWKPPKLALAPNVVGLGTLGCWTGGCLLLDQATDRPRASLPLNLVRYRISTTAELRRLLIGLSGEKRVPDSSSIKRRDVIWESAQNREAAIDMEVTRLFMNCDFLFLSRALSHCAFVVSSSTATINGDHSFPSSLRSPSTK